jgi:hypothetical protein
VWSAVDEDHVVEQIDRLEAEDQRRIAVLLEDDGGGDRRLQTVRHSGAHDAAKAAQRLAALLDVVRQFVQPVLNGRRRPHARDDAPFRRRERKVGRDDGISAREREPL